jgi:hypothetical protein
MKKCYEFTKGFKAEITSWDSPFMIMDQIRWCEEHTSKIKYLGLFERDAKFGWFSIGLTNGFYFEKESDRNWFLLRWS